MHFRISRITALYRNCFPIVILAMALFHSSLTIISGRSSSFSYRSNQVCAPSSRIAYLSTMFFGTFQKPAYKHQRSTSNIEDLMIKKFKSWVYPNYDHVQI
ncbi:hypothetical protein C8Q75DRAFT_360786 [Abortiporus biennis]|nr:hypothetical protein C8Q75DRAFT_360786 [Abortiporus biennis]